MTNYEIFYLSYTDLRHKFEGDNRVFTRKYTLGQQQIYIHCLKDEKLDIVECLDFLKQASGKIWVLFAVDSLLFFLFLYAMQCYFLLICERKRGGSKNVQKLLSFSYFVKKTMAFQKEHNLADGCFYDLLENTAFTHNVSAKFFDCYCIREARKHKFQLGCGKEKI